jgi:hypothetical protein
MSANRIAKQPEDKKMDTNTANLYREEDDSYSPVEVDYSTDGYKRLHIVAVRIDLPGEPGPNIIGDLDESQISDLHYQLCNKIDWRCEDEIERIVGRAY